MIILLCVLLFLYLYWREGTSIEFYLLFKWRFLNLLKNDKNPKVNKSQYPTRKWIYPKPLPRKRINGVGNQVWWHKVNYTRYEQENRKQKINTFYLITFEKRKRTKRNNGIIFLRAEDWMDHAWCKKWINLNECIVVNKPNFSEKSGSTFSVYKTQCITKRVWTYFFL